MFFYVYLDPDVVTIADNEGQYARQLLIGTLRGFLQNCLVIDFQDGRLQDALSERVKQMEQSFDRKLIKSALATIQKRNRVVYCLKPDYSNGTPDQDLMIQQAAAALIDLAVLANELDPSVTLPTGLEVTTLATYQTTNFEPERSRIGSVGSRVEPGQQGTVDFMNFHFRKAIRHAAKIVLCDRIFGRKFGDNFEYNIKELLRWIEQEINDPASCVFELHSESPPGRGPAHLEGILKGERKGRISQLSMTVFYYNSPGLADALPHGRFLLTDQVAIAIDRGFDFCDPKTKMCREVDLQYADNDDCQKILALFAAKNAPVSVPIV